MKLSVFLNAFLFLALIYACVVYAGGKGKGGKDKGKGHLIHDTLDVDQCKWNPKYSNWCFTFFIYKVFQAQTWDDGMSFLLGGKKGGKKKG